MSALFLNPAVRRDGSFRGFFSDDEYRDVEAFFAGHAELTPTPLVQLRRIAREVGVETLYAKDESARFGLDAFKITGVSYAVERLGPARIAGGLVCATAGNHGRAVARAARQNGVPSTVFVPVARTAHRIEEATRAARVQAMREDRASVIEVFGTYEQAVERAAAFGVESGATIVSDTSWPGYEQIPRWIMLGYTHLFEEASRQWRTPPNLIVIQGGVGGLVCAAASWFAARHGADRPILVAAEPEHAACLLQSASAGRPVSIGGSLDTIMAGLRCAEPSRLAWPTIASGIDAFVTVSDARVVQTMNDLAGGGDDDDGIGAGPSGACGLAALHEIALAPQFAALRSIPRLAAGIRALVVITEGATPVVR